MSERDGAIALAGELFAAMASFRAKRMFGGQGLFAGEVMFGLIDDGLIYLKTDAALEADLRAAGSQPWLYAERRGSKAGVTIETSYLSLPDVAYDDPDEACAWARRALAVAEAIKAAAPPRRGKRVSAATDPRR